MTIYSKRCGAVGVYVADPHPAWVTISSDQFSPAEIRIHPSSVADLIHLLMQAQDELRRKDQA